LLGRKEQFWVVVSIGVGDNGEVTVGEKFRNMEPEELVVAFEEEEFKVATQSKVG